MEAKWLNQEYTPKMDEYMSNGLVSCVYYIVVTTSFVGMGDIATKEAFHWVSYRSSMVRASSIIFRLQSDIAAHEVYILQINLFLLMFFMLYLLHVSLGMFVYSFLKLFFVLKTKENIENMFKLLGGFFFIKTQRTQKTLNSNEKKQYFSKNIKIVFYVFSKTRTK